MNGKWHLVVIKTQCILIILLNALLLAFILCKKVLRRKYSNWFLANLFFAHVVEGCVGYTLCYIFYFKVRDADISIAIKSFTLSTVFSYLTYVPVTLDRLFAVKWPFRYQMMKTYRVLSVIGILWLLTIVFAILLFSLRINSRYGDMITVSLTIVMFTILISANVLVYKIVRRQTENIKKTFVQCNSHDVVVLTLPTSSSTIPNMSPPSNSVASSSNTSVDEENSLHCNENKNKSPHTAFSPKLKEYKSNEDFENLDYQCTSPVHSNREISTNTTVIETLNGQNSKSNSRNTKAKTKETSLLDRRCVRSAYMCSGIVISFMLCWTPHALHDLLKITHAAPSIIYSDSVIARATFILAFCNGIIDPIIYVSMNRDIKRELKKLFRSNIVHPMGI